MISRRTLVVTASSGLVGLLTAGCLGELSDETGTNDGATDDSTYGDDESYFGDDSTDLESVEYGVIQLTSQQSHPWWDDGDGTAVHVKEMHSVEHVENLPDYEGPEEAGPQQLTSGKGEIESIDFSKEVVFFIGAAGVRAGFRKVQIDSLESDGSVIVGEASAQETDAADEQVPNYPTGLVHFPVDGHEKAVMEVSGKMQTETETVTFS